MNEARAPTDDDVKEKVRVDYLNGMKPKALSEKYGISINTIKSWLKRYKWGKEEEKKSAPEKAKGAPPKKKQGAPFGNKNAVGAGAPKRNKNAEKHGAYSSIYWDTLDEDERELLNEVPGTEETLLKNQIAMYTVRERRLMHKIAEFKDNLSKGLYVKGIRKDKHSGYDENGKAVPESEDTHTETENWIKGLVTLESELTKVQRAKTRCIDSLIKLRAINDRYDDLLNGWKAKAAAESNPDENGEDESVVIFLPDNGRDGD